MSDCSRAVHILRHARDVLVARLTEGIIEAQEEILDEAQGFAYGGPLETLHEQLGARLASVNALLAQLQASEADVNRFTIETRSSDGESLPMELIVRAEAFEDTSLIVAPTPVLKVDQFERFLAAIEKDELPRAVQCLVELFGIDETRAERCVITFRERRLSSPEFCERLRSLRTELATSVNGSLMLLWECFGLAVPESITVLETLKSRLDYA